MAVLGILLVVMVIFGLARNSGDIKESVSNKRK